VTLSRTSPSGEINWISTDPRVVAQQFRAVRWIRPWTTKAWSRSKVFTCRRQTWSEGINSNRRAVGDGPETLDEHPSPQSSTPIPHTHKITLAITRTSTPFQGGMTIVAKRAGRFQRRTPGGEDIHEWIGTVSPYGGFYGINLCRGGYVIRGGNPSLSDGYPRTKHLWSATEQRDGRAGRGPTTRCSPVEES
jgi:hypothetical protein